MNCTYCGTTKDLTLDHKIPKSLGGSDNKENLVMACSRCNMLKSNDGYEVFSKIFTGILDDKEWLNRKRHLNRIRKTLAILAFYKDKYGITDDDLSKVKQVKLKDRQVERFSE